MKYNTTGSVCKRISSHKKESERAEWTLGQNTRGKSAVFSYLCHPILVLLDYWLTGMFLCGIVLFDRPRLVSGVLKHRFLRSLYCFRGLVSYHRSSRFVLGLLGSVWRLRYSLWIVSWEQNEASALFFPTCPSQLPIIQQRANQASEKHFSASSLVRFY